MNRYRVTVKFARRSETVTVDASRPGVAIRRALEEFDKELDAVWIACRVMARNIVRERIEAAR